MSILPAYEPVESSPNSESQTTLPFDEPANATICHAPRCRFKTPSVYPSKLNLNDVYKVEHTKNEQKDESFENIFDIYTTNIITISSDKEQFINNSFSISTHIHNDATNPTNNNTTKTNESIQSHSLSILDALKLFSLKL